MQSLRATHNSEINVTPFLDVLLVLLVIFMAAVQAQRLLWAQVPPPSDEGCVGCETMVLEVRPGGVFRLNKAPLGRAELRSRLASAFAGRPTSVLFVKGHPAVSYQEVVTAFDEARGAGVRILAIAPRQVR